MEVRYYGFTLHLTIPTLGESVSIYKTAEACGNAVQKALSKGWSGYIAHCEYKPNNRKPNGYEIISESNKCNF